MTDVLQLVMQIDQLYAESNLPRGIFDDANLSGNVVRNKTNLPELVKVC